MNYIDARNNMIDGQLRPHSVTENTLLERFATVPRELFVPPECKDMAYQDTFLPLAEGRVMFSPQVTARLEQAVQLNSTHKVLVIAGGYGYTSALFCGLAGQVYMLETQKQWRQMATNVFADYGCDHIDVVKGPLNAGYLPKAPYDLIWIEGGIQQVPVALIQQLAPKGKIATVVIRQNGVPEATVFTRQGKSLFAEVLFETSSIPLLEGFEMEQSFVF